MTVDDIKCPHCDSDNVRLDEAGWIEDEMEAWACISCRETFTVTYNITVKEVSK